MKISFRGAKHSVTQDLKVNDRVFLYADGKVYSSQQYPYIGSSYECGGTIKTISIDGYVIEWDNGAKSIAKPNTLVLIEEFAALFPAYTVEDGFKQNDVVYIKHDITRTASSSWPMITTLHEVDCKVLNTALSPLGFRKSYELISGTGMRINATDADVISGAARDKIVFGAETYVALEDASPLFEKDQKFKRVGEYLVSADETVSIKLSTSTKIFELCSTSDKQ